MGIGFIDKLSNDYQESETNKKSKIKDLEKELNKKDKIINELKIKLSKPPDNSELLEEIKNSKEEINRLNEEILINEDLWNKKEILLERTNHNNISTINK